MEKEFKDYTLEEFLEDDNFCSWVKNPDAKMNDYFNALLEKHPEQKPVFLKAKKLITLFEDQQIGTDPVRKLQIWENINKEYQKNRRTRKLWSTFKYAAAIIVLLGIGTLIYNSSSQWYNKDLYVSSDTAPEKAYLQLNSGERIELTSNHSEIVYLPDGKSIQIGDIIFQQQSSDQAIVLNELVMPYGKHSKIVLADKTEVWVNAGSKLVFPASFNKDERNVKLLGEAFFKVTKDQARPFKVHTKNMEVKVLGTSFNIKAYPEDVHEEATLVEGSISLKFGNLLKETILMSPNEQVVLNQDSDYKLSKVNTSNYVSWVDGLFIFNDEAIPSVLTRISRYYNLNIKWQKQQETKRISGKLQLKDDYKRVLNSLGIISNGNFTYGNDIIYYNENY